MNTREAMRKAIILQALRRQRPGAGSSAAFLARRTAVVQWPDLAHALAPIPWAVVGAAATRLYMPERATLDLDVAVRTEDGPEVRRMLETGGFRRQGELSIGRSTWLSPACPELSRRGGVSVDVLECTDSWFAQALTEAQDNRDAQGLPVMPFRYLVLMKFQAGRAQDIADVTRMLGQAPEAALTEVRALFTELLPEELEDLESLIHLGKLELEGS